MPIDKYLKKIRDKDLMQAYYLAVRSGLYDNTKKLKIFVKQLIDGGAERFYVSEEVAYRRIAEIEKNGLPIVRNERTRLYNDLYEVYLQKCKEMPGSFKYAIIDAAVHSPAPSFYLSVDYAMDLLFPKK